MSQIIQQVNLLFGEIVHMHEHELYTNLIHLADLLHPMIKNAPGCLDPRRHLLFLNYHASSYYNILCFEKAFKMYETLYDTKMEYVNNKFVLSTLENEPPVPTNADIKYRMYQCLVNQKMYEEGIDILNSIPGNERTAKVNMALGEHHHNEKGFRGGDALYFREVLTEFPLALTAAELMLKSGMEGTDVNSFVVNGPFAAINWLNVWVKAYAHMHSTEYEDAAQTFLTLLTPPSVVADAVSLMVALGETFFMEGKYESTKKVFRQVSYSDHLCHRRLSILATVYLEENNVSELEKLVPKNYKAWTTPSPIPGIADKLTALAAYVFASKKLPAALSYVQNAHTLDNRNCEALVLKGKILSESKKYSDAIGCFHGATLFYKTRYEPYKGMIDCYLAQNHNSEALNVASQFAQVDKESARSQTLLGSVMVKFKTYSERAKKTLLDALKKDENQTEAVKLLVNLYQQEGSVEAAMDLLEDHIRVNSTSEMHLLYAQILHRHCNYDKAFDHYLSAIRLDDNNQKAKEGLSNLEKRLLPSKDTASSSVEPVLSENLDHILCGSSFFRQSEGPNTSEESGSETSQ